MLDVFYFNQGTFFIPLPISQRARKTVRTYERFTQENERTTRTRNTNTRMDPALPSEAAVVRLSPFPRDRVRDSEFRVQ